MENQTRGAVRLSDAVAKEVRVLLVRRDMKQSELAAKMGVSEMWLSRRLRGSQPLDLNDTQLIADTLNVEVSDLLPRTDQGRTVVVAGEAKRSTTVAKHTAPHRPHPTSQARRQAHIEATRRPVRISLLHA